MSASDLVQVTVVAPDACTAEWSATAALLQQPDDAAVWLYLQGRTAILLTEDRVVDVEKEEPSHG